MAERQTTRRWAASERLRRRCIWTLVAYFALVQTDHVPFVEDQQTDVVKEARVVPQREIQLFRRGDHDVTLADCVFVEAADADAPVERRDRFPQASEGPLQGGFGLGGQRTQRRDEDDSAAGGQTSQDAEFRDPGLAGTRRQ